MGAASRRKPLATAPVNFVALFMLFVKGLSKDTWQAIDLGVAVLLDAFLVRLLLVPVLLRLVGKWAWWIPRWLGKVLPEVRFGH